MNKKNKSKLLLLVIGLMSFLITSGASCVKSPASFVLSELTVPSIIENGDIADISVAVTNIGGDKGTYIVTLKINGKEESKQEVLLKASETQTVTFSTTKNVSGIYSVDVNGLTRQLTVISIPTIAPSALCRDGTYSYSVNRRGT